MIQVRLHLLTAVMKCFFKRPPETQKALGAALAAGLADFHQVWIVVSTAYNLNCQNNAILNSCLYSSSLLHELLLVAGCS